MNKAKRHSYPVTIKEDQRWRCESDLSTLMEAEKIKADPKRYAMAQALAKKKMMMAAKVATEQAES